jgi:hypothetical protein
VLHSRFPVKQPYVFEDPQFDFHLDPPLTSTWNQSSPNSLGIDLHASPSPVRDRTPLFLNSSEDEVEYGFHKDAEIDEESGDVQTQSTGGPSLKSKLLKLGRLLMP